MNISHAEERKQHDHRRETSLHTSLTSSHLQLLPATSAMVKVLETYELLENILASLSPQDIATAARVCKVWRMLVHESKLIRRARCLRPKYHHTTTIPLFGTAAATLVPYYKVRERPKFNNILADRSVGILELLVLPSKFAGDASDWKGEYFSSPPVTNILASLFQARVVATVATCAPSTTTRASRFGTCSRPSVHFAPRRSIMYLRAGPSTTWTLCKLPYMSAGDGKLRNSKISWCKGISSCDAMAARKDI